LKTQSNLVFTHAITPIILIDDVVVAKSSSANYTIINIVIIANIINNNFANKTP
jgi:hypothetical protein